MYSPLRVSLAAACLTAALCTGCGDRLTNRTADHRAATDSAVYTDTTRVPEAVPDATGATVYSTGTTETSVTDTTGLIDRAEDALEDAGDAVTGVLTKLTSEIHNHTAVTTAG